MTKHTNLGKALLKSRFSKATSRKEQGGAGTGHGKWLHTSDLQSDETDWNKLNLRSVTEQNSLDEFLTTAELAGTDFESERLNLKFATPKLNVGILSKSELQFIKDLQEKNVDLLRIPRKPEWKGTDYDATTLQLKERESFLEWRKKLSLAQENQNLSMTPFEKNLEFWRQLWRVIERSDVVVQIVDARNPLLFFCNDLEKYVNEVDTNKINIVLINKSDFLTESQRLHWLNYFESKNIRVVFWSAVLAAADVANSEINSELDELDDQHSELDQSNEDVIEEESDEENEVDDEAEEASLVNKFNVLANEDGESDSETEEEEGENKSDESNQEVEESVSEESNSQEEKEKPEEVKSDPKQKVKNQNVNTFKPDLVEKELNITEEQRRKCKVLNRDELISLFKTVHAHIVDKAKPGFTTIGLVGYPNVGKSSTINALFHNKKVAVSETPGKTKHYQTLFIDDDLLLCDCPGLVFPSFVSTRGELIINGILPIDQMRDYTEPINLVLSHIPKVVFEMIYGVEMPKPKDGEDSERLCTAEELCTVYALGRGYMNHKGMPDVNRGSRYLLKDYVNGKLLYCYPPPNYSEDPQLFQEHRYEMSKELIYLERLRKLQKKIEERDRKPKQTRFDKEFFEQMAPKALSKGGIVGYHRKNQAVERGADISGQIQYFNAPMTAAEMAKTKSASKKHFNAHKREKLRRKTSHFDRAEY